MSTTTSPGAPAAFGSTEQGFASSVFRLGHVAGEATGEWMVVWQLKRNCSLAPRQLLGCYGALCALSFAVAIFFWWFGARVVMSFASVELLIVGAAILAYARHAGDRESIALRRGRLTVEHASGNRLERTEFQAQWLNVEASGSLVVLSSRGRRVVVGQYVRPELRRQLADELRMALRHSTLSGEGRAANQFETE